MYGFSRGVAAFGAGCGAIGEMPVGPRIRERNDLVEFEAWTPESAKASSTFSVGTLARR